jgi:WD40 repeat protein
LLDEFPRDSESVLSQCERLAFAPDGEQVLIAEMNGTVTNWDLSAGEKDETFVADCRSEAQIAQNRQAGVRTAVFSKDGKLLIASGEGAVHVWDVETHERRARLEIPGADQAQLAISPDGQLLAASQSLASNWQEVYGLDAIRVFDLQTNAEVVTLLPSDTSAMSVAFSPDGRRLVSGLQLGTAIVWDVKP